MIPRGNRQILVPATTLAEMYRTLSPAPLVGRDALRAFLFAMTLEAADRAGLAKREVIGEDDVWKAIRQARANYRNRLGSAKEDAESVPYAILREKLLAVYGLKTECNVPDLALNRLLQTRAILHFNGDYWYGVHPLVVDILKEQEHLEAGAPGGVS